MRITMAKAMASRVGAAQMKSPVITSVLEKHTASLIFLHGSGDTGDNMCVYMNNAFGSLKFSFPHIKIIYPSAPFRRYTPMGGIPTPVWFDRPVISPHAPEDIDNIDEMCDYLEGLVAQEWDKSGIPASRIIVGGLSMGGALALHFGYRFCIDLAGVFALSSFLNEKSSVFEAISEHAGELPPLYQTHGISDTLVLAQWGGSTHKKLRQLGVVGQYQTYPNLGHMLNEPVVEGLRHWILSKLPIEET